MYNYGQSPQQHNSSVPIKEETNKSEDNNSLFYNTGQPAYSSPISSSFTIRYPSFDSNSFVHNQLQHNQDVYNRNQDHSINSFNAFHSVS